ncbi:hypothetical protein HRG_008224 [Hirsutella rhossiliensis]|uniref:Uncharacterized protein n=1 Tax=Hirsutella rhossiliensis TaxID=111463 RepID=A0A9P8SHI8_9HYPO|nr:uncharacterized protein HRG_08224 [Hirsutella rhossiliensis]KAH0961071.1 hypothetical protein HRG_08224 [Hirsutella rhossiliensis]
MVKAEDRLGITCPKRSKFYVCSGKPARFVGCCSVNPCDTSDGNCPQESLEYTSFNKSAYNDIPAQDCVKNEPGTAWYACAYAQPPFMGCCSVNPCQANGCPAASLRAGALSEIEENTGVFLGKPPASSSSSTASTAASTSTASSVTSSATNTSTSEANSQINPGPSKGAIAGISVGVTFAAVFLVTFVIIWLRKRFEVKRKKQQQWQDPSVAKGGDSSSYQNNFSPNSQSMISPCTTSPFTTNNSPYTNHQSSPSQQWNSYQPSATQYDAQRHYDGAGATTAELSAVAADGTRRAYNEKMGHGPAELGTDRSAGQFVPVELGDSTTYDREVKQPAERGQR